MHRARRVFLILFPVLELTGLPSKQFSLKKKFFLFIYYFWLHGVFVAVSGLSPVVAREGLQFIVVHRLLIAIASLVADHRL